MYLPTGAEGIFAVLRMLLTIRLAREIRLLSGAPGTAGHGTYVALDGTTMWTIAEGEKPRFAWFSIFVLFSCTFS